MSAAARILPTVIAEIHSDADFIKALRDRQQQLAITNENLDAVCGLADKYAGKVLAGIKGAGPLSRWLLPEALGLKVLLVEDHEALARTARMVPLGVSGKRQADQHRGWRTRRSRLQAANGG